MNNDDLPSTVFAICGLIMILLAALGDVIKGVGWLRTWGWKIEEIRFESSAFIGYRLVR